MHGQEKPGDSHGNFLWLKGDHGARAAQDLVVGQVGVGVVGGAERGLCGAVGGVQGRVSARCNVHGRESLKGYGGSDARYRQGHGRGAVREGAGRENFYISSVLMGFKHYP